MLGSRFCVRSVSGSAPSPITRMVPPLPPLLTPSHSSSRHRYFTPRCFERGAFAPNQSSFPAIPPVVLPTPNLVSAIITTMSISKLPSSSQAMPLLLNLALCINEDDCLRFLWFMEVEEFMQVYFKPTISMKLDQIHIVVAEYIYGKRKPIYEVLVKIDNIEGKRFIFYTIILGHGLFDDVMITWLLICSHMMKIGRLIHR